MMFKKSLLILILLFTFPGFQVRAQVLGANWKVPDQVKGRVATFKFTKDNISLGEALFQRNCKACHGDPGQHNFAKMVPVPPDPASEAFQQQTDGEMYFRITTGKAPMPSFKTTLTGDERWDVIAYIRSFNSKYVQPNPDQKGAIAEKNIKMNMYCDYKKHKIYVLCNEITKDNRIVPVDSAEIQLLAARYFGNLPVAASKLTNKRGEVTFDFPKEIPGNKYGTVTLISRVNDETGLLGEAETSIKAGIGIAINTVSLTAERAMWNVRSKAPIWVMLSYSLVVIVVWGFILYIIISVARIKNIS
jgi:mono/diheme cytochrome c family protein